jgi:hypothetical protein
MHIPNPIDRAVLPGINRRAHNVRVFPNGAWLVRTTILVKINEKWAAADRVYIRMDDRNG